MQTITINGNSTTWSDTWRPITDDYKLGESGTSLSSLGSLTLYNDLLDRIPNTTNYVWVTYEIVSKDFSILLARNNHSSTYALNSYGQCIRITAISWEQNG